MKKRKQKQQIELRGVDGWGSGAFGASRGSRTHNGVDVVCQDGEPIKCFKGGRVSKIGYPYADDLGFKYVEITDADGNRWRYFYVRPSLRVGEEVRKGAKIGTSQSGMLMERYPASNKREAITPHYHLEIINPDGEFIDPTGLLAR